MTTAVVTGTAPGPRVRQIMDAAVSRLGVDHVVIRTYEGAALEAADWALLKGVRWSICEDVSMADPDMVMRFPGGDDFPGLPVHEIKG